MQNLWTKELCQRSSGRQLKLTAHPCVGRNDLPEWVRSFSALSLLCRAIIMMSLRTRTI